jgi:hypothetical protein
LVSDIPAGVEKIDNLFYSVTMMVLTWLVLLILASMMSTRCCVCFMKELSPSSDSCNRGALFKKEEIWKPYMRNDYLIYLI